MKHRIVFYLGIVFGIAFKKYNNQVSCINVILPFVYYELTLKNKRKD